MFARLQSQGHLVFVAGTILAMTCFGGCGTDRGPERTVVSGSVAYNGQPVGNGMIRFVPARGSAMPTALAYIVDGKYQADSRGGVPVGSVSVQIEGYRQLSNDASADAGSLSQAPQLVQYIPEKYNARSKLQITIEPGSGRITKDFELTD